MAKKRKGSSKKKALNLKGGVELHKLAHYTFFAGIIIAVLASFFRNAVSPQVLITTLVLLGFVVGLFNLTAKETVPFLIAALALMLAGIVNLSLIPYIGTWISSVLSNIVVFVVPGAIIVALKTVWKLASD